MEIHIHIEKIYIMADGIANPIGKIDDKKLNEEIEKTFKRLVKLDVDAQVISHKSKIKKIVPVVPVVPVLNNPNGKTKPCKKCGKEFVYKYNREMYCSIECKPASYNKKLQVTSHKSQVTSNVVKQTKFPLSEFHAEHYMGITDLEKRSTALYNKRFNMKKARTLTNIIDSEITSMLDDIKESLKGSKVKLLPPSHNSQEESKVLEVTVEKSTIKIDDSFREGSKDITYDEMLNPFGKVNNKQKETETK